MVLTMGIITIDNAIKISSHQNFVSNAIIIITAIGIAI